MKLLTWSLFHRSGKVSSNTSNSPPPLLLYLWTPGGEREEITSCPYLLPFLHPSPDSSLPFFLLPFLCSVLSLLLVLSTASPCPMTCGLFRCTWHKRRFMVRCEKRCHKEPANWIQMLVLKQTFLLTVHQPNGEMLCDDVFPHLSCFLCWRLHQKL